MFSEVNHYDILIVSLLLSKSKHTNTLSFIFFFYTFYTIFRVPCLLYRLPRYSRSSPNMGGWYLVDVEKDTIYDLELTEDSNCGIFYRIWFLPVYTELSNIFSKKLHILRKCISLSELKKLSLNVITVTSDLLYYVKFNLNTSINVVGCLNSAIFKPFTMNSNSSKSVLCKS